MIQDSKAEALEAVACTAERRRGGLRSSCWRMMTRHGNRRQNVARNVSTRQHAHQQGRIISGRCAKPSAGHMSGWDYISPMVRHSGNTKKRTIVVSNRGWDSLGFLLMLSEESYYVAEQMNIQLHLGS